MRVIVFGVVAAVALQITGCASVANGTTQAIRIETTTQDGKPVDGAKCSLTNDKGSFSVDTPGSVLVHRSSSDLKIECKKDPNEPATAMAISRVTGSMFGNILLGGGIGAIVDSSNGSAYNYPEWMRLVFGENLVFDRHNFKPNEPTAPNPAVIPVAKK